MAIYSLLPYTERPAAYALPARTHSGCGKDLRLRQGTAIDGGLIDNAIEPPLI